MKIVALIVLGIVAAEGLNQPTFDRPDLVFGQEMDKYYAYVPQRPQPLRIEAEKVSWILWKADFNKVCRRAVLKQIILHHTFCF